jgi:hypothetical protein
MAEQAIVVMVDAYQFPHHGHRLPVQLLTLRSTRVRLLQNVDQVRNQIFAAKLDHGLAGPLGTFSANLQLLPGAMGHPKTMEWWAENHSAFDATRADLEEPANAMRRYIDWLRTLPGKPVFVAYPAGFDFLFVYWYLIRFVSESPFSFSALDMKTFAMALLKSEYRAVSKKNMPKRWFDSLPHTHVALDDAVEQGALFCNMLAENHTR